MFTSIPYSFTQLGYLAYLDIVIILSVLLLLLFRTLLDVDTLHDLICFSIVLYIYIYVPSERTQTAFGKKRKNRKREEEEEFGSILGSFSASGGQMGLIRLFRQSGSKSMCFISQSGRDPLFRCRVANLTCKKPCKTH